MEFLLQPHPQFLPIHAGDACQLILGSGRPSFFILHAMKRALDTAINRVVVAGPYPQPNVGLSRYDVLGILLPSRFLEVENKYPHLPQRGSWFGRFASATCKLLIINGILWGFGAIYASDGQ